MKSGGIHLDGIIFSLQAHGGISVYFRELLSRLAAERVPGFLSLEEPLRASLDDLPARMLQRRPARALERYRSCRAAHGERPDVFHSSYYRLGAQRDVPAVVTVHDFAYERCVGGLKSWVHSKQKFAAIRQAQAIICISESTRDDLLEFVGVRTDQSLQVVYNGVSERFHPLQGYSPGKRPYALFVGQRGRYKNFRLALDALALLPELELWCVGGGALQEAELASAGASTRARVRHLGQVDDARLNLLYNQAQCLLYPSAYEGFGIPVLEAMRAGCPVVCIHCKAVLEVGGVALSIAHEASPAALATALRATAGPNRTALRARGLERAQAFSWDRHYQETLAIYRSLGAATQNLISP